MTTAWLDPLGGRPFTDQGRAERLDNLYGKKKQNIKCTEVKLPCGKCPECLKSYYTSWATRGSRELSRWDTSVFITLTYSDENLPADSSLQKSDVQKFIKRVKKHFQSTKQNPIRQIYCGEYGEKTKRPHYHVILFNCDFDDRREHYLSPQNYQVFTSELLTKLWGHGFAEFGYAQPGSIAYLFKYILKKKSRKEQKAGPLEIIRDGITYKVAHEFIEASRNPGIGAHLRGSKSLKKGYLSVDGVKQSLPKYYMEHLRKTDPDTFDYISNLKFDFMSNKPKETSVRRKQKEHAQKKLTDTKKKL